LTAEKKYEVRRRKQRKSLTTKALAGSPLQGN